MSSSSSGVKLMPGAWSSPKEPGRRHGVVLGFAREREGWRREAVEDGDGFVLCVPMVPHAFWIYRLWDDRIGLMKQVNHHQLLLMFSESKAEQGRIAAKLPICGFNSDKDKPSVCAATRSDPCQINGGPTQPLQLLPFLFPSPENHHGGGGGGSCAIFPAGHRLAPRSSSSTCSHASAVSRTCSPAST
jgi:hypothetical protein